MRALGVEVIDGHPVELRATITPDLLTALQAYAAIYSATYGVEEPVAELVPAMLATFLESDRGFVKARDAAQRASA